MFSNTYENEQYAEAYSRLEFPGDYYLAFRDLPQIFKDWVKGKKALDFGCGAGRSTRFLENLGFEAVGVDKSAEMLSKAVELDPSGRYFLINDNNFSRFEKSSFDLIFAAFTFDNIPGISQRTSLLKQLRELISETGVIILLDSTPDIYFHEWLSFSTKDFPANRNAKSGDIVKIYTTVVDDKTPVDDIIWFDGDYRKLFEDAGMTVVDVRKPLGREDEPFEWVNETTIAPWVIYVLQKNHNVG